MRGVAERAGTVAVWHGHGPEIVGCTRRTTRSSRKDSLRRALADRVGRAGAQQGEGRRVPALGALARRRARARQLRGVAGAGRPDRRGRRRCVAVLERMVKERPDDARSHTTYSEYLSGQGKTAEALAYLEKVPAGPIEPDATLTALMACSCAWATKIAAAQILAPPAHGVSGIGADLLRRGHLANTRAARPTRSPRSRAGRHARRRRTASGCWRKRGCGRAIRATRWRRSIVRSRWPAGRAWTISGCAHASW